MEFAYVLPTEQRLLLVPVCSLATKVQGPGETEPCWSGWKSLIPFIRHVRVLRLLSWSEVVVAIADFWCVSYFKTKTLVFPGGIRLVGWREPLGTSGWVGSLPTDWR